MAKYLFYVGTTVGSEREEEVEIPDEELEGMEEMEKEKYIHDHHFLLWLNENADIGFYPTEEE